MARRKKSRKKFLLIAALFMLVGLQATYSLSSQFPVTALRAANFAQAGSSGTTQCTGSTVFVYSQDFANANAKNQNRPIGYYQFLCPAGSTIRFLEGQSLSPSDACKKLPPQTVGARSCLAMFYAVVWKGPTAGDVTEDNFNGEFELISQPCRTIPFGGTVGPHDCDAIAKDLKKRYQGKAPALSPLGTKTPVTVAPSRVPDATFWQTVNQGLQSGDIRIAPHTGFSGPPQPKETGILSDNNDHRTWGLNLILKIPVR